MKILKNLYYKILGIMPKALAHKILYYRIMKKKLNLKNPKNINEKIQWLIVYKYGKKEADLADKILVKDYVAKKCGTQIIPKLYGVYNNASEIDITQLPNTFVLKTNNGSGDVFVCFDKRKFDFNTALKTLNKNLKVKYSRYQLEYHYDYIKPKILCEELLMEEKDHLPFDYKFFCFNGKVEAILVCSNREKNNYRDFYDVNWNYIDFVKKERRNPNKLTKPENLNKMINYAEKISSEFPFVRVDLYNINGKIYFGEMTFSPAAGLIDYCYDEALDYLGNKLDISKIKKHMN